MIANSSEGLEGIAVFTRTFPRRQRDLNHSIQDLTDEFYAELEYVRSLLRLKGLGY
jgi:hypothetical protein